MAGMKTATGPEMTANLDSNLDSKFEAAATLLREDRFVAIHIKGADIAAHDRRPVKKRDFITAADVALRKFLESDTDFLDRLRVVVSADHATSSITGNHMVGPVPVLVATWRGMDVEATKFDEDTAEQGALGLLMPGELPQLLWMETTD